MNLVKVGSIVLNFDEVRVIHDFRQPIPTGGLRPGPLQVIFESGHHVYIEEYAEEFRAWLATQVTDLTPT
jgi:hypothetical protein